MPQGKYLTPDTPAAGFICRRLLIPNGLDFLAIVTGAVSELIHNYRFEKFGDLTPEETAAYFRTMLDDFTFTSEGGCRVIGEIIPFAGDTSPLSNWLVCDGASLLRADYPDLFTVIGTTYGAVDGTHFSIPDLRGRTVLGAGEGTGLTSRAIGDQGGEETHVLDVSELATHNHTDTGHTHIEGTATATLINGGLEAPAASALPSAGVTGSGSANLTTAGDSSGHNNMQPFTVVTYLIVAA